MARRPRGRSRRARSQVACGVSACSFQLVRTVRARRLTSRRSKLAARYKLPAIYFERYFATGGGLISFRADFADQYQQALQAPTKYQMAVNLKAAKALGLTVPPSMLARADEVIE